jgi:hypothetical protein
MALRLVSINAHRGQCMDMCDAGKVEVDKSLNLLKFKDLVL